MEIKAKIAGINVCFDHIHYDYFLAKYGEYLCDFAVFNLRLIIKYEEKTVPQGKVIFSNGTVKLLEFPNGDKQIVKTNNKGITSYSITYNKTLTEIYVYVSKNFHIKDCPDEAVEFALATLCFNMKLIQSGGMMFHSSCIDYKGDAICFSAPSGTGKSTHTQLWRKVFGDDVKFINDDKPAIKFNKNDIPYAYGLPYSGKDFLNSNTSAPVKAIVFIERSKTNSIRKIDGVEAVYKIVNQTFKVVEDKELYNMLLETVEKFVLSVPCYILSCDMSEEAVITCYNELYKK